MKQNTILTKVIIGIMLLFVLSYILFSLYRELNKPYEFVRVYHGVIEYSLESNGLVVRDEVPIDEAQSIVGYEVDEGEKVGAQQVIATAYNNQIYQNKQHEVTQLQNQIDQISYAIDNKSLAGITLTQESRSVQAELQSIASTGNYKRAYDEMDDHKKMVLRRAYLESEEAEAQLGMKFLQARQEIIELEESIQNETAQIIAPQAGVFSSYLDGYELLITTQSLAEVDSEEAFLKLGNQEPIGLEGIGKIVTSFDWKLAVVTDEETVKNFKNNWNVKVRFSSLQESVKMRVEEKRLLEDGKYLVVMRANKSILEVLKLRQQEVSIVFQSEEGVRIPKEALRVREDGTVGVYTVTGYRAEFKPVTVLAENEDEYVVETPDTGRKSSYRIRSNDEVIITTMELHQGKVVR